MQQIFTVYCQMDERWIPSFLKMLNTMQHNGDIGRSEFVGMYSDGDGDYRPRFDYDKIAQKYCNDNYLIINNPSGQATMYDAG